MPGGQEIRQLTDSSSGMSAGALGLTLQGAVKIGPSRQWVSHLCLTVFTCNAG